LYEKPVATAEAGDVWYRTLFERSQDGILLTRTDGTILDANAAACRMLGMTAEEVCATGRTGLLVPGPEVDEGLARREESGVVQTEVTFIRKDGTTFPAELTSMVIDAGHPHAHAFVHFTDVTERKQAEREIQIRAQAIEQAGIGIWRIGRDGRIISASGHILKLLGYSAQEFADLTIFDIATVSDPSSWKRAWRTSFEKSPVTFERECQSKSGEKLWLEFTLSALTAEEAQLYCIVRDVTARRALEEELVRKERHFRALIENSSDLIATLDEDGTVTFQSPSVIRCLGYRPDEVVGQSAFDLVHPDDVADLQRVFAELQRGRDEVYGPIEARFRHADGSWKILETVGGRMVGQGESGYIINSRDVTDHRKIEEAWRSSHALLAKLSARVPGMVYQFYMHPDGRTCFPWCSPGSQDAFEVTADEVLKDAGPIYQRLHPDDHDQVLERIGESARTQTVFHIEYRVLLPRQGLRWHLADAAPEMTEEGGTLWHGIIVDITERKEAQESLRESESRYRQLVDASHDFVWEIDEQGRFTYTSHKVFDVLGYTPEEMVGRTIFELTPPEEAQRLRALIMPMVAARQSFHDIEGIHTRKDGHPVTVESTGIPLFDDEGAFRGYRGIDHDITVRTQAEKALRESEEQLRQSQKMEAIGRLAGGIAHDFNNLLTAIIGNSSLVLATLAPEDPRRELVSDIKQVGERAADLTHQILAFSRRQVLSPRILDLNAAVAEMKPLLERTLGEDITLKLALESDLELVKVDRTQIEQVILNLAVNARDAMPSGGQLAIETANAEVSSPREENPEIEPGQYVVLTVRDTGSGMDKETLSHMFEPFFTTKEIGQGTGLGLSTVLGIVQQSGGAITVRSGPGQGSIFRVFLPVTQAEDLGENHLLGDGEGVGQDLQRQLPQSQAPATILVVEDESSVRQLVVRVLSNAGYTVLAAGSGREAEKVLAGTALTPALLITDLVLPGGMDGGDVADLLLARDPATQVIFMSGYDRHSVVKDRGQERGFIFLKKPFTPDYVLHKVREVLDGRPAAAPMPVPSQGRLTRARAASAASTSPVRAGEV